MKILQINKYLYNVGGAETYMFKLAEALEEEGHQVKFWGMADARNLVDDEYQCFAEHIDYKALGGIQKITSSLQTVYSFDNKKKIKTLLDAWEPDVIHLHNYNFQLTPSILKIFKKRKIKVVQTVHDSQMVCPYHRLYNFTKEKTCTKCVEGSFINCVKDRCFDNSFFKSLVGASESFLYHGLDYYNQYIDCYISPSHFLSRLISKRINKRIEVLPNFVGEFESIHFEPKKESFYLYYGRISKEKGILELFSIFEKINLKLVIIGNGPESDQIPVSEKIEYLGPKYGNELMEYVAQAKFVIQPSIWYENCPMTVVESFSVGTPVIGANHSGFKELIVDDYNGYLVDFTDKNNLETRLLEIDANYSQDLRVNAREFYIQKLSKNIHMTKIIDLYKSLFN